MAFVETGDIALTTDAVRTKWILAITRDNDEMARQILHDVPVAIHSRELLEARLVFRRPTDAIKQPTRQLSVTSYSPDTPWCLAAVCDSRRVMELLLEHGADLLQVNSNGNNMLHVLAALASTGTEKEEEDVISTARHIRNIVKPDIYCKLLLTENSDGLRPLELAGHLGAFALFRFYFDTKDLYITREDDHTLYKIQYFEITEYVTGVRFYQSPLNSLLNVEKGRITTKSVEETYLTDPMRSWVAGICSVNIPVVVIWAMFRIVYISFFLSCDVSIEKECTGNMTCDNQYAQSVSKSLINIWVVLVISVLIIAIDLVDFIRYILIRPRWLNRVVYDKKRLGMTQLFYRITHFLSVFMVAIMTSVALVDYYRNRLSYDISGYGVIAGVYGFVWSFLYFFQILPMFGHYVMAVQRMLNDFINFAILFILFFVTYSVGFYKLLSTTHSLPEFATFYSSIYGTFRVMLNMVDFRTVSDDISTDVYALHITFTFMIAILLMNFLIATLSSSYEHVMNYRKLFVHMQILSVSMIADGRFQTFLAPLRNYLLRRYFVHEKGRYFVCRFTDMSKSVERTSHPTQQP